jgi:hypothetical protein
MMFQFRRFLSLLSKFYKLQLMTIFQKQDQKTILNLTIHHQHLNDFHKTSSMIVRTVTPLFCVGLLRQNWTVRTVTPLFCVRLLRQNWTFCGRRLYSCLVAREKITTFFERLICLLLVSNLNLLSKSKSLLFTNFTSYILPSSTKNEGGGVSTHPALRGYIWM